ncbi:helix-turn-helix transcriptional regulator [Flavobacterium sp.]|uniref:helix-turn-helix domain-containing protein n=1 Tax=Flavobacterium sp. TaxID=239 RepID=UPI00286D8FB8|nr:helix-turn-helix transcriptional regulator [Flavobacterium sp.]
MVKEEHQQFLNKLGKRIGVIRASQKLTKVQLAFELNTGEKYIRELEKGNINPTTTTLLKLAEAPDFEITTFFAE